MKTMTLVHALNDFFASPKISRAEIERLQSNEREYFKRELEKLGYEIIAS